MKQAFADLFSGMHRHNQEACFDRMTKMHVTAFLPCFVPAVRFKDTH